MRWYVPRREIDDGHMGPRLEPYCYPLLNDQVMTNDKMIEVHYPGDVAPPYSNIPDIER